MNPRFKGLGFFLLLVPVLLFIPIRAIAGDLEDTHRNIVLFITLFLSGTVIFMIAAIQDKKVGISAFSRNAWTTEIMESQHICFHIPLRMAGVILVISSVIVLFLT
jgi:hypothetical protein